MGSRTTSQRTMVTLLGRLIPVPCVSAETGFIVDSPISRTDILRRDEWRHGSTTMTSTTLCGAVEGGVSTGWNRPSGKSFIQSRQCARPDKQV